MQIKQSILLVTISLLLVGPTPAQAITFDFSWSSSGSIYTGDGPINSATGSGAGQFTLTGVGAGDPFSVLDVVALDVTVTSTNVGTTNYGLEDLDRFDGTIDLSGDFAAFQDVFLENITGRQFGCGDMNCSLNFVVHRGDTGDGWDYGPNDAQASFMASIVPVPAAAWLFGSALGLLGWMRREAI